MIQLVIRMAIAIAANGIGLLAASLLLNNFKITGEAFVIAVLVFTAASVILSPLVSKIALTSAPFLLGGTALVTTLVALIVTNWLSDGFSISGVVTWIQATLIVWIFSIVGSLVLPWLFIKAAILDDPNADLAARTK